MRINKWKELEHEINRAHYLYMVAASEGDILGMRINSQRYQLLRERLGGERLTYYSGGIDDANTHT